jgi:alkylresorcinol/alkylpyrone synthase
MFIAGLGTAVPAQRYAQARCWEQAKDDPRIQQLSPRARAVLRKVLLGQNGIESRHLVLDSILEALQVDPDTLHARFAKHAPLLASQAGQRALDTAGVKPAEIDAVIVSTCTGYLCPGLTSYVAESLGLRPDVFCVDLVGQGCGAALPNLRAGESFIAAGRAHKVLSVCVEVCSAAIYFDEDPGVLVSACLFADGAGAAVLGGAPRPSGRSVEWLATESLLDPASRDLLRFETKGGLLRNILTPPVPALAAKHAAALFETMAEKSGVKHKDISAWIFHAGGRDVITALRQEFNLTEHNTRWSADVLRELGNISSPFVFHVLERALHHNAQGGLWWMCSFGAGFSCHGAFLKVD